MKYPPHLLKLITLLKKLPGVGSRSAERFAFHMLNWREEEFEQLAEVIQKTPSVLKHCEECGCLIEENCGFCDDDRRDSATLCIVAYDRDVFSIEGTHEYHGMYHVLGGLLSPLEGKNPEHLRIGSLLRRVELLDTREIIIALDSTLEGDATALYLQKRLSPLSSSISRLAFGIPMGSALDYVDGGTLARAFVGRSSVFSLPR